MATNMQSYCSVSEAAVIIGVTTGRVRQMLRAGQLVGDKLSETVWVVPRCEAEKAGRNTQKTGRPRSGTKNR